VSRAGARLRDGAEHRLYAMFVVFGMQLRGFAISAVAFGDFIVADQQFLVAMETFFMQFSVPPRLRG
jgi:hypothetical protein